MIKIVTGYSGPGGSTVVFNTLTNLFNENGLDACLYGPSKWVGIDCKFKTINEFKSNHNDVVIYHFLALPNCFARKIILSCHETKLFNIKNNKRLVYDQIHFVSEFQKEWHGVDGVVIPNPIRKLTKNPKDGLRVVGIIGSVDRNKRTHISIKRALEDGFNDVRIYGHISDLEYYNQYIKPLLGDKVKYIMAATDMDGVYRELSHVYHSPELETYNLIKPECEAAGVTYVGFEGNDTKAEYWTNERILGAWRNLIST